MRSSGLTLILAAALATPLRPGLAAQLDSATFFALDRGMSESELLVRAGEPDLVTYPGGEVVTRRSAVGRVVEEDRRLGLIGGYERSRYVEIKEYHYIPDHTEHDPHLTVITLRAGRIFEMERTKLLTRPKAPAEAAGTEAQRRPSDTDIRIERVDRVLEAAEAYAETRARLKGDAAAAAGAEGAAAGATRPEVYRATSEEGVPYFGDRPPSE